MTRHSFIYTVEGLWAAGFTTTRIIAMTGLARTTVTKIIGDLQSYAHADPSRPDPHKDEAYWTACLVTGGFPVCQPARRRAA